jgi:hypothetical protein
MSSEVVTTSREYNGGTAEIHTIATPTGYRVTGNYHTTGRGGRLVDGLVGGNIVAADDIDAEVERVAKLADAAIGHHRRHRCRDRV